MANETVIKGGTVYDGTGAAGVRADVGIAGGRITEIGPDLDGDRVLDAGDCVVAPGFIDIHTHYDAQVFWDPALTPSCFHGVTTVVAGNCGFSIAPTRVEHHDLIARTLENVEDMDVAALAAGIPWDFASFPEYLASVANHGVGINFTAYIGHTALRLFVMGDAAYERTATSEEVAEMQRVLREAMEAGAAGFATSFAPPHQGIDGKPVPSRFADREEFEALLATMGEVGRGVVSIAPGEQCPPAEMFDLQMKVGVPFTWGALLTSPGRDYRLSLDANDAGWARGAEVWPQVTPRPLTFTFTLDSPYPLAVNESFSALQNASVEERTRAYADPEWREVMKSRLGAAGGFGLRWDTYTFGPSESHPELADRKLIDIAAERNVEPLDCLLDLALDEPGLALRVRTIIANDDEAGVANLLVDEHCTLGLSDAGAHAGQLCDAPQATDLLGKWVRDKGVVPMEQAIRKLSGLQADLFGFEDRGYLRPGAFADVAVFDPATVAPGPIRRVNDFPAGAERLTADAPVGMHHVVVNGAPIRVDGESTNAGTVGQVEAVGATVTAAPVRDGASNPVVVEAAINGANPDAPRTPDEIARCALACFDAGAAVVHNHVDLFGTAEEAAARYREGWDPVLAARPDALLYPTINGIGPVEERYSHITPLAEGGGLRIGVIDPGSVNLGASFAYVNAGSDIEHQWTLCDKFGLVPGMSIFEPGFLRAALAYWRAGKLPPGTMLRFYFGGREAEADGGFTFGLAPTERALDAYLELLGDCPLPWSVTVVGGDLFATDLPALALERGGHLRVGLEDHRGRRATNEELVEQAVAAVHASGRPLADCATAAEFLGLKASG